MVKKMASTMFWIGNSSARSDDAGGRAGMVLRWAVSALERCHYCGREVGTQERARAVRAQVLDRLQTQTSLFHIACWLSWRLDAGEAATGD
jgi:hypothetical protein